QTLVDSKEFAAGKIWAFFGKKRPLGRVVRLLLEGYYTAVRTVGDWGPFGIVEGHFDIIFQPSI
ncbi:hypothetical protein KI387_030006, partial [Taxus chinensis]